MSFSDVFLHKIFFLDEFRPQKPISAPSALFQSERVSAARRSAPCSPSDRPGPSRRCTSATPLTSLNMTAWRNGSAFDSRSKGWAFDPLSGQNLLPLPAHLLTVFRPQLRELIVLELLLDRG